MACRSWRRKIPRESSKTILSRCRSSRNSLNEGKCHFCRSDVDDEVNLGKLYRTEEVNAHYYCLLFASGLKQEGDDDSGIMGFLSKDIEKEIKRGQKLKCYFCKHNGATIGCSDRTCSIKFHFPCGLKNNTLHLFFEFFSSFCAKHRPCQKILPHEKKEDLVDCRICLNPAMAFPNFASLRAPCCKNSWFHRDCLQQQALNSGYFFKCPLCNNKENFLTEMRNFGIYIPEQDASWELEENAFQELHERYNKCDHKSCRCRKGRNYSKEGGCWEIILCEICGSKGTHLSCGRLKWQNPIWECEECKEILQKDNSKREISRSNGSQEQRLCEVKRKRQKSKRKHLPEIKATKTFIPNEDVNKSKCVKLSKEDIEEDVEGSDSRDEESVSSECSNSSVGNSTSDAQVLNSTGSYTKQYIETIVICDSDSDEEVIVISDSDSDIESVTEISVSDNSRSISTSSFEGAGCSNWKSKTDPVNAHAADDENSSDNCLYKKGDAVNISNSKIELFQNSEQEAILKITLNPRVIISKESQRFTGAEDYPCDFLDACRNLLYQLNGQVKSSEIHESDLENSI